MTEQTYYNLIADSAELHLGDCLEVMKKISSSSVDLVITDIPYGKVNRFSGGLRNLDKGLADVLTFNLHDFVNELDRVCNGSIYVFCGTEQLSELRSHFSNLGWTTRLCIWEKTNPSPMNGQYMWLSGVECCIFARRKGATFNEHCKNTVWRFPNGRSKTHPTEKPIALFKYLVEVSSNLGNIVLDPCMGSGTSGVVCKITGRKYIGIELNNSYFEIAKNRILNHGA